MEKLLLFLAIYLPFQLALNPSEGVDLASGRVLILILFFAWLAQGLKNKKLIIKNNLQTWLVVAFLFINGFSIVVARNTDWSARKLLFLFSVFPLYFVAARLINNREKMKKICQFAVAGAAATATIGIAQFLSQFVFGIDAVYGFWANHIIAPFLGDSFSQAVLQNPSWLVNISGHSYLRATAVFPDPHMFSFYLGMSAPLALGLAVAAKNKKIWLISFLVILAADLLTFSRGGYLGIFAGLLLIIILFWKKFGKKYKIGAMTIAALAVALLLIQSPVSQRFYSSFDLKEGSNKGRIETWQKAGKIIAENPILGVGIGNYPLAIKATASYREPIYAHNAFLDIAAETGIINAVVWAGMLFFTIVKFYQKRKESILFLMGAISIVIFGIHSLVETPIYSSQVLPLFLLIISFANIKEKNV